MALAYFITWTVYGSWLPGDRRLSVNEENRRGAPFEAPNAARVAHHRELLEHNPIILREPERQRVEAAIREVCAFRDWALHALNVRSNHVHVVLTSQERPEKVMVDFKARATRQLRELDPHRFTGKVWTKHGSTRYLFDTNSVLAAIEYVVHHQDRK